jgi:hypothetical protein
MGISQAPGVAVGELYYGINVGQEQQRYPQNVLTGKYRALDKHDEFVDLHQ